MFLFLFYFNAETDISCATEEEILNVLSFGLENEYLNPTQRIFLVLTTYDREFSENP